MMKNLREPASEELEALKEIETWLLCHEEEREGLNATLFGISNKMKCHPHDLAIYLLIRTASI